MSAYFEYLKQMIIEFFTNLGHFFSDAFAYPWSKVPGQVDYYNSLFANYSPDFGGGGWFFFILFLILLIAAFGALGYLVYYLIRRYVHFRASTEDTTKYREEIERLNLELYHALSEKDRVLGLQVHSLATAGIDANAPKAEGDMEKKEEEVSEDDVRFPKLCDVDARYATPMRPTVLP